MERIVNFKFQTIAKLFFATTIPARWPTCKSVDRVTVTYETPGDKNVAREIVQGSETFTGEVTAIDLNDRTVKAKAMFGAKQFNLGDNCAIVINGKMGGELNALKLGDRLEFNYNDVNGVNVANRIATAPQPLETTSAQPLYP